MLVDCCVLSLMIRFFLLLICHAFRLWNIRVLSDIMNILYPINFSWFLNSAIAVAREHDVCCSVVWPLSGLRKRFCQSLSSVRVEPKIYCDGEWWPNCIYRCWPVLVVANKKNIEKKLNAAYSSGYFISKTRFLFFVRLPAFVYLSE